MQKLPSISLAACADPATGQAEVQKLRSACLEHGFFYLCGHGVDQGFVNDVIASAKAFFSLPAEVKSEYGHHAQSVHPPSCRGYVPLYGETLHQSAGPDPKEIFDIGIEQAPSGQPFVGQNFLPDNRIAPDFKRSQFALQDQILTRVMPGLIRALAQALRLNRRRFDRYFTNPTLIQRVIKYPPGTSTAGKHTDNGFVTVLIQESLPVSSLQVYTKGTWMEVPSIDESFVVNLGDMLQLWTDGLFVSTPHRVIHRSAQSRISIPFFIYPDVATEFQSLQTKRVHSVREVMLKNFESIWVSKTGAGRARELV